jgi:hypothetical protein
VLQAPRTADKKIVVLPQEITREDVRIIMWNILDTYGATSTERSLIARSTFNMFGVINEVCTLGHAVYSPRVLHCCCWTRNWYSQCWVAVQTLLALSKRSAAHSTCLVSFPQSVTLLLDSQLVLTMLRCCPNAFGTVQTLFALSTRSART